EGLAGPARANRRRMERDTTPGRGNFSRDRESDSSPASIPTSVSRQADKARGAAHADAKASRGAAKPGLSPSLDATIRRVQKVWDASSDTGHRLSAGDAAAHDVHVEMHHMKGPNGTYVVNSRLGKRSSSGAHEVLERKRRAVEDGSNVDASKRQGPAKAI